MNSYENLINHIPSIEAKIGYHFTDPSLLRLAFVHRSFVNENRRQTAHNERLEFLGDSILGIIVSEYLYHFFPNTPEGELSFLRSRLVEFASCATYVKKIEIGNFLLLGKGEKMNDGKGRESILADLFEALIGAIYLDGGLEAAKKFFFSHFQKDVEEIIKTPLRNWKAILQDYCQKKYQKPPIYEVVSETGPDHDKVFTIKVIVQNHEIATGIRHSKKEAQQAAASEALKELKWDETWPQR